MNQPLQHGKSFIFPTPALSGSGAEPNSWVSSQPAQASTPFWANVRFPQKEGKDSKDLNLKKYLAHLF
tara:strand:+ start:862 stop:1065 length:204 start_codon:yes stop_codon:yes gene_type:complete